MGHQYAESLFCILNYWLFINFAHSLYGTESQFLHWKSNLEGTLSWPPRSPWQQRDVTYTSLIIIQQYNILLYIYIYTCNILFLKFGLLFNMLLNMFLYYTNRKKHNCPNFLLCLPSYSASLFCKYFPISLGWGRTFILEWNSIIIIIIIKIQDLGLNTLWWSSDSVAGNRPTNCSWI